MATAVENLQAALDLAAAKIKEAWENPKPNYSLDGESYSWADYLAMLNKQYQVTLGNLILAQGPYEVRSIGTT